MHSNGVVGFFFKFDVRKFRENLLNKFAENVLNKFGENVLNKFKLVIKLKVSDGF